MGDIAEAVRNRIDASVMGAFYGTTAGSAPSKSLNAETLIADMRAAFASIPPAPIFASSVEYPRDDFWTFEREGREYVIGHPDLWTRVPRSTLAHGAITLFGSVQIRNVDYPHEGELRGRIRIAIATASHVPGRPVRWPRGVEVTPSVRSRLRS